jgi:hypothetical protein
VGEHILIGIVPKEKQDLAFVVAKRVTSSRIVLNGRNNKEGKGTI